MNNISGNRYEQFNYVKKPNSDNQVNRSRNRNFDHNKCSYRNSRNKSHKVARSNYKKINYTHKRKKRARFKLIKIFLLIIIILAIFVIYKRGDLGFNIVNVFSSPEIDIFAKQIPLSSSLLLNNPTNKTETATMNFYADDELSVDDSKNASYTVFNYWQSTYPLIFQIYINNDKRYIYESGIIMPNNYVDFFRLDLNVKSGEYSGIVKIFSYSPINKNKTEVFSKNIKIIIK